MADQPQLWLDLGAWSCLRFGVSGHKRNVFLFENGGFPRPCDSQVGGGMTIVQIYLKFMYSENGNE